MNIAEIFTGIGLAITILSGIGLLIFRSGRTFNRVERVEKDVAEIKTDVNEIRISIPRLSVKVDTLWEARIAGSNSPRQLNELGKKLFKQSGIERIIEQNSQEIIQKVRDRKPQNAYQAEEVIIEIVRELKNDPLIVVLLEDGAFNSGTDVDTVLLAGAIGMRDYIMKQLNLEPNTLNTEE